MGSLLPVVDHALINVAGQLDETEQIYQQLGFLLTPRGHHSLGSSNHLAVFGDNYLELLGYEAENAGKRPALWAYPPGLAGLVWKTQDADAIFDHLLQRDLADEPPASFYRPVTLSDGSQPQARFRTVRLAAPWVENGRSFFCQHLTPDLVWRPEWQQHANGARELTGFTIAAADPRAVAAVYGRLFDPQSIQADGEGGYWLQAGSTRVRFITYAQADARYGTVPRGEEGSARMVALELGVSSLAHTEHYFQQQGVVYRQPSSDQLLISADRAFNVALLFRAN